MVDSIFLAVVVIAIIGLAAVFYVARRDGWPDPVWWTRVTVSAGLLMSRVKDLFTRSPVVIEPALKPNRHVGEHELQTLASILRKPAGVQFNEHMEFDEGAPSLGGAPPPTLHDLDGGRWAPVKITAPQGAFRCRRHRIILRADRRQVVQALVIALIVVVLDELADAQLELARQVIVLQQDAVLH